MIVCVDGFTLTHTPEPIDIPDQEQVDGYLPRFEFPRALDPMNPMSIGTLVASEHVTEVCEVHHRALLKSMSEIEAATRERAEVSGRDTAGLLGIFGSLDAPVGMIAIRSAVGTLLEAMDQYPELDPVRLIRLRCFRPFPLEALKEACAGLSDVIVLERALSPGSGGIVVNEVRAALSELQEMPRVHAYAMGLGARHPVGHLCPCLGGGWTGASGALRVARSQARAVPGRGTVTIRVGQPSILECVPL